MPYMYTLRKNRHRKQQIYKYMFILNQQTSAAFFFFAVALLGLTTFSHIRQTKQRTGSEAKKGVTRQEQRRLIWD